MSPDVSAKLAALPGVRAAAEEMARELHDAYRAIHRGYAAWDDLPDFDASLDTDEPDYEGARLFGSPRRIFTEAQRRILCDLTRPASRDWWARWLAERVGVKVGATAPRWERRRDADDPSAYEWALCADEFDEVVFGRQYGGIGGVSYSVDVNDITDPAEALAAACLAVGGAS